MESNILEVFVLKAKADEFKNEIQSLENINIINTVEYDNTLLYIFKIDFNFDWCKAHLLHLAFKTFIRTDLGKNIYNEMHKKGDL